MEGFKVLVRKLIIWLLDNDEIREAITKHIEEKLYEIKIKIKDIKNEKSKEEDIENNKIEECESCVIPAKE